MEEFQPRIFKSMTKCVPESQTLELLKRELSVREWREFFEGVIVAYEICRVTIRFARLTPTYQAWFHNDDVISGKRECRDFPLLSLTYSPF